MENNVPFGPNVRLPTIEGITSTCEEDLYTLMKEIDLAFQRNHRGLLVEVGMLKTSEEAKRKEIESLKHLLKAVKQPSKDSEERIKQLLQETEKLKIESNSLKNSLQNNLRILSERDNQVKDLKNNLVIQKEENVSLKGKLTDLNQNLINLQANYQSLLNLLQGENMLERKSDRQQSDGRMQSDIVNAFISQEKEKYLEEENQHCSELLSKISSEIEQFRIEVGKRRDGNT